MNAVDIQKAKVVAILNTASGSCDAESEHKLRDILTEAGVTDMTILTGTGETIEEAFADAKTLSPEILIVLGGDGTIRAGAEACNSSGPLLIPLPGGTMNMLPKALYGNKGWEEVLRDTLRTPKVQTVSGGSIHGKQFFIAAIIGAPTLWAKAREALRKGDLPEVVDKGMHAFQNMLSIKVSYEFADDTKGEADVITVLCPLISEALESSERTFEAAVIDASTAGAVLELASAAAFGAWRDSTNVTTTKTHRVHLSAQEEIPIILDGETVNLGQDVEILFIPASFNALVCSEYKND